MIFPYTGERMVPWNPDTGPRIMHHHVARYAWALPHCWQRDVCDLATGTGYGAFMLSWAAKSVRGLDIDEMSISYARQKFVAKNLHFSIGDMTTAVPIADLYIAFECLEHIDDPATVLQHIGDGELIYSMPVNDDSKYHKRPYTIAEIEQIFGGAIYYQSETGAIVEKTRAWFDPVYALGVTRV